MNKNIPQDQPKEIFCGEANKFYRCVNCDSPCGSEGHYIEVKPKQTIEKDINYYKENCQENYMTTPISVLRYITQLEEAYNHAQKEIDMSKLDLELSNIDLEKTKKLLKHCENALQQRDKTIEELRRDKEELVKGLENAYDYFYNDQQYSFSNPIIKELKQLITKHNG